MGDKTLKTQVGQRPVAPSGADRPIPLPPAPVPHPSRQPAPVPPPSREDVGVGDRPSGPRPPVQPPPIPR